MAITTKQIAEGLLAEARFYAIEPPAPPPGWFTVVSHTSDWFESLAATGTKKTQATALSVSVEVSKVFNRGDEELTLELYESNDLKDWSYVDEVMSGVGPPDAYDGTYAYASPTSRKKYFRIVFRMDDPEMDSAPDMPYPNFPLKFEGSCWVTVYHKE